MASLLLLIGVLVATLAVVVLFFSRRDGLRLGAVAVTVLIVGSLDPSADVALLVAVGLLGVGLLVAFFRRARGLTVVVVLVAVLLAGSWAVRVGGPVDHGAAPPSDQVDECRDVAFLGLRGSGEARDAHRGYGDIVGPVRDEVARIAADRGLTFADMPVDYPALAVEGDGEWSLLKDLTASSLDGGSLFLSGAALGEGLLTAKLNLIHSLCGGRTDVIVVGYSQGAMVAHGALAELPPEVADLVIGVDLIADPWRAPATLDPAAPVAPPGQGIARALLAAPPTSEGLVAARSWCHEGDPVCDWDGSGGVGRDLLLGGSIHHDAYASPQWRTLVVERLRADLASSRP